MSPYPTAQIRNVALVGHHGAGKTTLAEALLFATGAIPRPGRVEDGTTVCDTDPEEQRRGMSVALAKAHPTLLEPVSELLVIVPEPQQGDVMSDLTTRRGRIRGSCAIADGEVEITAMVPTAETTRYAVDLSALTGGRGRFTRAHRCYEPVPAPLAQRILAGP